MSSHPEVNPAIKDAAIGAIAELLGRSSENALTEMPMMPPDIRAAASMLYARGFRAPENSRR